MTPGRRTAELLTFGGRVPAAVGLAIAALVGASLAGALAGGVRAAAALSPAALLAGEAWRLVTWAFVETQPIDLVFAALVLFWLGRDLSSSWGARRFLLVYLGLAAGAAGATALLSVAVPGVVPPFAAYLGSWPVVAALTLAWGLMYPERQVLLYLALPVSGRAMVWVTLGGTFLFILFGRSLGAYVPHLAAEGLAFAYVRWWRRRPRPRGRRPGFFDRLRRGRGRFEVIHVDRDPDASRPRWLN